MKIVILDGHAANPGDLSWEGFERLGNLTVYGRTGPDEVVQRIGDAEAAIVNKINMHAGIFSACPALQYVGELATGYNNIDIEAATAHGVRVTNVPAYSTDSVAQMTFALLLELCHRVGHHHGAVQDGRWAKSQSFSFWEFPLIELAGKTLGVVGFGAIGRRVAEIGVAFGMRVLATGSKPENCEISPEIKLAPLDTILKSADVLTLHCPLTPDTAGLINQNTLAKMKDGAILINTARGQLLNEADARRALETGKLAGLAVDVVSVEPIEADNSLLGAPNCVITPHIAWAPLASRRRLIEAAVENLASFLSGGERNRVNPG